MDAEDEKIADLEAWNTELLRIVVALPLTRDGVRITLGMRVWRKDWPYEEAGRTVVSISKDRIGLSGLIGSVAPSDLLGTRQAAMSCGMSMAS